MNSSSFGPPGWSYMFYVAAGYDLNETPKNIKDKQYETFFRSIGATIPCRYCRDSYGKFFDSLEIYRYMNLPSCGLIRFVYDLKNLVSNKLTNQEDKALQEEYQKLSQVKSPEDPEFWKIFRQKAHKICYTKPAPEFDKVVEDLMKHRAGCSAHMKTCRDPLNVKYPAPPQHKILDPNVSGILDRETYSGGRSKTARRYSKSVKKTNRRSRYKSGKKSRKR